MGSQRAAALANPPVQENSGNWTDGVSTFVDLRTNTEATWSNAAPQESDVVIGNDAGQTGGTITLGSAITVPGKITFGPIFPGFNYTITDGGSGNTLTIGGGVNVNNVATTSSTPSAEIDAPIILSASQNWNVDPNQLLDVKGQLTGNTTTLTKIGAGTVLFEHAGGSLGTLNANGGVVAIGAPDALGTAVLNLNSGGFVYAFNGTANSTIAVGASGGSLGTAAGFTATVPNNLTTTNNLTAIGTGTTILSGTVSVATLTSAAGSTGVFALTGTGTIGTLVATSGITALAGVDTVGTITQNGGTTVLASNTVSIGTVILSGGTLQVGAGTTTGSLGTLAISTNPLGTAAALGTVAFDRSDTITITNSFSGGSFSLQQSGLGTLIVANSNTFVGGTGINSGTLALGVTQALGASGTMNFVGPSSGLAVFNLAGFNQTVAGLRSGGTAAGTFNSNDLITNDKPTTSILTIANTGVAEYDGNISGNLNLVHSGTSTEILGGNSTFTGTVALSAAGTLQIGGGTSSGSLGTIPVTATAAATIAFNRNDTVTINNSLSGASLSLQQTGTGMTIIGNTNSYTGGTGLTKGPLQLGVTSALGPAGTMTISGGTSSLSTFDMNGFSQRVLSLGDGSTATAANESVTNSSGTASTLSFASGSAKTSAA